MDLLNEQSIGYLIQKVQSNLTDTTPYKLCGRLGQLSQSDVMHLLASSYSAQVESRGILCPLDEITLKRIEKISNWLMKRSSPGLILYGTCGTGKTTMVKALQKVMGLGRKYYSVSCLNACQIVDYFRSEETRYQFEKAKTMEVLLIDDLGCEPERLMIYGTVFEPIKDILYYRYDRMLITVLTTNLGDEEICTRYGVRIADRMNETFDAIVFKGTSYRGRKQRPR